MRAGGGDHLVPYLGIEILELALRRARVVDFFWGQPDPALVRRVHEAGALASWQVGSAVEAVAAEAAGCDFIIAQDIEAGGRPGHARAAAPAQRSPRGRSIPVLAAGGIGSARSVAAALAAGAAGVRVGTRLIAAAESNAPPTTSAR